MFSKDGKMKDVNTPRICDVVWHDGEFIKWNDARVHVMSHVLHYGSSIFEGIRCYATKQGPAVFRLREHMQRFLNSAKIYRMDHTWTLDQLCDASVELVRRSGLDQCYIRPILFRSLDEEHPAFGVNPFPNPLACYIGAWDWGKYLGDEAIEKGVDVCVSTWNRLTPNSMPAMAKSGANYMNSQLIKMEALLNGFAEGIALDDRGYVSEGSGENIFRGSGRHRANSAAFFFNSAGHHSRQRDSDLQRTGNHGQGAQHSTRGALRCRRTLLLRHGGRDHADSFGRPHHGRQRRAWRNHRKNSEGVLRDHQRRATGARRLAHLRQEQEKTAADKPGKKATDNGRVCEVDTDDGVPAELVARARASRVD